MFRDALVTVVIDDQRYSIGGPSNEGTTDVFEVYDPNQNLWTATASLQTAREYLSGGAINERTWLVADGDSARWSRRRRVLTPRTNAWATQSPMPTTRAGIAGNVLDGYLFVFGWEGGGEQIFEDVSAYHPPTDTWTPVIPLPTPRSGLGVGALDGRIYTEGGAVPSS